MNNWLFLSYVMVILLFGLRSCLLLRVKLKEDLLVWEGFAQISVFS
jgi:hypothetical protein